MNFIHATAIVHPLAVLGEDNWVGPYCTVGPCVKMGNGNRFESFVSIGSPPEKKGYFTSDGITIVGSCNVVREFVTINGGTRRVTKMGDRCVMLRGSHLSHDSVLEDDVTISCTVMIGGESYVMKGANIGLGAVLHQFSCVGSYSMIGMGSVVTKTTELRPGYTYVGNPAKELKFNRVGVNRHKISEDEFKAEWDRWVAVRKEYCGHN